MADLDDRWQAVLRRDARADGEFVYSVTTTGVYSRPSCAARLARRENVIFFDTAAQAAAAGYRPCRRCDPDRSATSARNLALVIRACRDIDGALGQDGAEAPSLDSLASGARVSRFHFHRMFKKATGITPRAYLSSSRARRVRTELLRASTVTDAIYNAGFNSNGRFYASAPDILGMTPTQFRAGGRGGSSSGIASATVRPASPWSRSPAGECATLSWPPTRTPPCENFMPCSPKPSSSPPVARSPSGHAG
ncbi:Ada metal-binding domain-containing protein [Actinomadura sp. BRA 177]|uniref:bifunctional transcriptional activator/DNA repair enzyme AdaA n=1 Tax=Actinomadura sp. BRA 177 TaxID=2745202 RepID=UPI001595B7C8|nr:Ada metal-binding domain-containing protein [Actinomadura sp. BRA 177]NVI91425.1 methylphosphotriester-DNA--protein-cysteine methyltransferase family protein [Actinomadura sp. BRA 177]